MKTQIKIINQSINENIFGMASRANDWMADNKDHIRIIDVRYVGNEKDGCIMIIYEE